jgi:SAM-dependent methyltransferase
VPFFIATLYLGVLAFWAVQDPYAASNLRLLLSFIFFSIPIYLTLTYFYDPESLVGTMSFFSRISYILENVLIPKRIRQEIIQFFTEPAGKRVLEFGSGVGTLTIHLASHVGKNGKVYAVDLSPSNVQIIEKRIAKLGHSHVDVIHDPHLISRVHPNIKSADIIVSINNLGYIQDVKKVLKEMNRILPPRGKICFVEYIDLFYFLPNPKWLSSPELVKEAFENAGFTVTVNVRRGIFWKYIYGIKESKSVPYI